MKIPLTQLKVNPLNEDIYDVSDLDGLQASLSTNGQLEPIVCNKRYVIVSGHRRYYAMERLGWNECEARMSLFIIS